MGAKQSLEDDLINFKMTAKQMARSSRQCEKKEQENLSKLKNALAKKNVEGAKVYAQNAIRAKNEALNYLKLESRIDAVASRLETAVRMQAVSATMATTVKGMSSVMATMNGDKIAKVMEEFEKQFEDMDVVSEHMEKSMDNSMASSTPADEVENLMQKVAAQNGLELGESLAAPSSSAPQAMAQSQSAAAAPAEDDLDARLAALRSK